MPKCPRRTYKYNFSGENEFEPPIIDLDGIEITEKSKAIIQEIINFAFMPISKQEFAVLYAKLKVLCKWHSVPADEKVIMVAYYDELSKYPAVLVREALKPKYEWFPSFSELKKDMEQRGEHLFLLKSMFCKNKEIS